jgi:hypothetical protein
MRYGGKESAPGVDKTAENGSVLVTQAKDVRKAKRLKKEKYGSAPGGI